MTKEPEMLRPADIAPLLGVTPSRIYQLIARGEVPAVKVGGALRIPLAAWEEWLRRQTSIALSHQHQASQRSRLEDELIKD